jgi:3-oxoacyl-[acyl-carrier protein] reductase
MIRFEGRVLFLTGASGGIGRAIAALFHDHGARLFLADSDAAGLAALQTRFGAANVATHRLDVTDSRAVAAAVEACRQRFGGIDYLVPAAGLYDIRPIGEMTDADWRRVLDVNLGGVFFTCRAAVPHLNDGGAIVTIASIAGHRAGVNVPHYAAAKGAVLTFTRSLAVDLAPRIRANAVSPGLIDTPMIAGLMQARGPALLASTPLKRLGRPEEVADAVAYLCSDRASFITGETLHINGGLYIAS